jgi:hypothetical protein
MKKILKIFSTIVIFLFILSLFGWTVYQISNKNKRFGFLTEPIKFMYTFPDLFKQSVEEVKEGLPETFIPTDKEFKPINKLEEDVYALTSYSDTGTSRSIVVRNLKNDSVLHKWTVNNPHDEITRIFHPVYLSDGSLVYYFGYTWSPMRRIDASGNVIWEQDQFIFHHGMELNKDGDIWACARVGDSNSGMCKIENRTVFYFDYTIAKLDIETGEVLFHKSISELLKENNLANYILKAPSINDPIHLNDIQPALKSTDYYEEDDVFLSLRTLSCIIHYRPSTNKVIKIIEGPFVNQHDVDFLNDHTLAIFNNNLYVGGFYGTDVAPADSSKLVDMGDFYSNIVTYDLRNGEFSFIGDSIFRANKIYTGSEGLQIFIDPKTYFVEEQNSGLLWIIRDDEVIYKNVFKSQHEGYHHLPNWTRIIKYD